MITKSTCTTFAVELLSALSAYDINKVRSMFTQTQANTPLDIQFPKPIGFQYRSGVDDRTLVSHYFARESEVAFDFEMPFEGDEFRPMMVRTLFKERNGGFIVLLEGVVPT